MADNVSATPGSGVTLASDDISSVQYPRIKITLGADGVNDGDVSSANPMPVSVSGVATAANQATGNAALAAIQTAVEILDNAIAGTEMQVDVVSSALPTGAATEAKQDSIITAIGNIPGGGGTQYNIGSIAGATDTGTLPLYVRDDALSTLSDAEGDYVQGRVDATGRLWTSAVIDSALPAGTNAIGKLAANSGVDIGDVDVTSVTPGTGSNNLGKAEDAAHTTGDVGVMPLAVRNDAGAALAGTDGDYIPLSTDSNGYLRTRIDELVPGSGATNLGKAEDAVHVSGDVGVMALGVRSNTAASTSGTDGDYQPFIFDTNGKLWANAELTGTPASDIGAIKTAVEVMDDWDESDRAKVNIIVGQAGVAGGSGTVGATTQRVTLATDVALPTGSNTIGKVASATSTTGGATPYKLVSAATTNATSVKGSAGTLYAIQASNVNASARYLKIYDKASAPTVGTDTPIYTFIIPGASSGAGTNIILPPMGVALANGLAFALTTEATDAGTTAVAADEIVVNLTYA